MKICDEPDGRIKLRAKQKYEILSATSSSHLVMYRQSGGGNGSSTVYRFRLKSQPSCFPRGVEYDETGCVALCGWAAKADDSIVCFGEKPDKGFLDMKSRRIRKWEGDAREAVGAGQQAGVDDATRRGQLVLDSREASSGELAWNHGQGQSTPESGDSRRQDRVQ